MVSQILGLPPFPGDLVDYTTAQLDFCLEMYALDHPDRFKFVRQGQEEITDAAKMAAWSEVLMGKALAKVLPELPLDALRRYRTGMTEALKVLQNAAKE